MFKSETDESLKTLKAGDLVTIHSLDEELKRAQTSIQEEQALQRNEKKRKAEAELVKAIKEKPAEFKCAFQGHIALVSSGTECSTCKKLVCKNHLQNSDEVSAGANII